MVLILNRAEVKAALPMRVAVRTIEESFRMMGLGRATAPKRICLPVDGFGGSLLCMPAYLMDQEALAVGALAAYPGKPEGGGATVNAAVVLFEPRTGEVLAIFEGGALSAIRTGAAAGVATKYMASEGARVAAIFGAGAVGRASAEALNEVIGDPIIRVYDIVRARAERLAKELLRNFGIAASVAGVPKDAIAGAEVVVTATTSNTPVFDGRLLESGAHVNAMGASAPDAREIDTATAVRARGRIVVDSKEACLEWAGDLLIPLREGAIRESEIFGEIGDVIARGREVRRHARDVTLFKSVGMAVQDAAAAAAAYRIARSAGIGREIQF